MEYRPRPRDTPPSPTPNPDRIGDRLYKLSSPSLPSARSSGKSPIKHPQRPHILTKAQLLARDILRAIRLPRRPTRTLAAGAAAALVAAGVGGLGGGLVHEGADAGDGFGGGLGVGGGVGLGVGGGRGAGVIGGAVDDGAVGGGVLCERGDEARVDFGERRGRGVVLSGVVVLRGLGGV